MELKTILFLMAGVATLVRGAQLPNMNGDYAIANAFDGKVYQGTQYGTRDGIEFIDLYSPPIQSTYGQGPSFFWVCCVCMSLSFSFDPHHHHHPHHQRFSFEL